MDNIMNIIQFPRDKEGMHEILDKLDNVDLSDICNDDLTMIQDALMLLWNSFGGDWEFFANNPPYSLIDELHARTARAGVIQDIFFQRLKEAKNKKTGAA